VMSGVIGRWSPSTFHLILFALGGGLVYLGQEWGIPYATDIGIVVLGFLAAAAGIDLIIKRLRMFRTEGWANVVDTYRGVLELLWGVIFICLGLLIIGVIVVVWLVPGTEGEFWSDMLLSNTGMGVVLSVVGLMLMLNGLIRALAGSGRVHPGRLGGVPFLLDRLGGAGMLILGLGASAVGIVLVAAPGMLAMLLDRLKAIILR
jgi:hypothetical protein